MADPNPDTNRVINEGEHLLFSNIGTLRRHIDSVNPNASTLLQTRLNELNTQCFRVDVRDTIRKFPLPAQVPLNLRDQDFIALYCDNFNEIDWIPLVQAFMTIVYYEQNFDEPEITDDKYMIYNVCKNHGSRMQMNTLLNFTVRTLLQNYGNPPIELEVYFYNMYFNQAFNLYARNGFETYRRDSDKIVMRYVIGTTRTVDEAMEDNIGTLERVIRRSLLPSEDMITDDSDMRLTRASHLLNINRTLVLNRQNRANAIDDGIIPIYGIISHGGIQLAQLPRDNLNRGNIIIPNGLDIRFKLFNRLGNLLWIPRELVDPLYISNEYLCQLNTPGEEYHTIFPEIMLSPDDQFVWISRVVCRKCHYVIINEITHSTTLSSILIIIDQHHTTHHSNLGRNIQVNCSFCTTPGYDEVNISVYLTWYIREQMRTQILTPQQEFILLNIDTFISNDLDFSKNQLLTIRSRNTQESIDILRFISNCLTSMCTRIVDLTNNMGRDDNGSYGVYDTNVMSIGLKIEQILYYMRVDLLMFQGTKKISKKVKKMSKKRTSARKCMKYK